jgi:hypothetical protein
VGEVGSKEVLPAGCWVCARYRRVEAQLRGHGHNRAAVKTQEGEIQGEVVVLLPDHCEPKSILAIPTAAMKHSCKGRAAVAGRKKAVALENDCTSHRPR